MEPNQEVLFREPREQGVAFEDVVVILFGPVFESFNGKLADKRHFVFI